MPLRGPGRFSQAFQVVWCMLKCEKEGRKVRRARDKELLSVLLGSSPCDRVPLPPTGDI